MRGITKREKNMVEKIERYGWFALGVAPAIDSDDPEEWFTYTIGLPHTFGWPEFICFGLGSDISHALLTAAIDECTSKGLAPTADMILMDVIDGWPAKLIDGSHIPNSYVESASWFARHIGAKTPPDLLQLLWPDADGVFPDEVGCAERVRLVQTPVELQ